MSCDTDVSGRKSALKLSPSSHFMENGSKVKTSVVSYSTLRLNIMQVSVIQLF